MPTHGDKILKAWFTNNRKRPIYILDREKKDFYIKRVNRVIGSFNGNPCVRYDRHIYPLYTAQVLKKFYSRKTGFFGRKKHKVRLGAPKFIFNGREVSEDGLNLPFIKAWDDTYGLYA